MLEFTVFKRGLFSHVHLMVLVVSVVLVVSSAKKDQPPFLNNPLPSEKHRARELRNLTHELSHENAHENEGSAHEHVRENAQEV